MRDRSEGRERQRDRETERQRDIERERERDRFGSRGDSLGEIVAIPCLQTRLPLPTPKLRSHVEKLKIYKLSSRNSTTQNDLYQ